jgi:hypothetical protein
MQQAGETLQKQFGTEINGNPYHYRIVKVGRGTSAPRRYKKCVNCGGSINDFRIESLGKGDVRKKFYCIHCAFKSFLTEQERSRRWYRKFFQLFFNKN